MQQEQSKKLLKHSKNQTFEDYLSKVVRENSLIVCLVVALFLFQEFASLIILICAILIAKQIQKTVTNYQKTVAKQVQETFKTSKWQQIEQKLLTFIQFIKYNAMIEFGYEFQANTNLILNQVKEKEVKMTNTSQKIYCKLKKIDNSMKKIIELMQKKSQIEFELSNQKVKAKGFKQIIFLNRSIRQKISIFKLLPSIYRRNQQNPFINKFNKLINSFRISYFVLSRTSKLLSSYRFLVKQFENQREKQLINQNFSILYQIFISQECSEDMKIQSQKFLKLTDKRYLKYLKDQKIKEKIVKTELQEKKLEYDNTKEKKVLKRQSKPKEYEQQATIKDKKQFMNQLDNLMLKGWMKKKQQDFDEEDKHIQKKEDLQKIKISKKSNKFNTIVLE